MGTKKVITEEMIEEKPQEIRDPIPIEGEPELDDIDVNGFLEQFGDSPFIVKIHKFGADGRTRYINESDMETVSEQFLQDNWGEGKYRLVILSPDKRYKGSKILYIGPPLKDKETAAPAPVFQDNGRIDRTEIMLEVMREESRTNRDMMFKLIESMNNRPERESNAKDLAEIIGTFQAFMPKPSDVSPVKMISDALPIIKDMIHMMKPDSGPRGWIETAKEVLPEVVTAMKGIQGMRQPGVKVAAAAEQIHQNIQGNGDKPLLQNIPPEYQTYIQRGIGFLKSRAAQGQDPGIFVNYILATLDDDQSKAIARLLDMDYETVAQLDPDLTSNIYRPWFEEFFGSLKDALLQSDVAPGDTGDAADPGGNETPGPEIMQDRPEN